MSICTAFRLAVAVAAVMVLGALTAVGCVLSIAFLQWWAFMAAPLLLVGGLTAIFAVFDWGTDPRERPCFTS